MKNTIEEMKRLWPDIEFLIMDNPPNLDVWTSEGDYRTIKKIIQDGLTMPYKVNVIISPDVLKEEMKKTESNQQQ
jgi:hypothetical protein